MTTNIARGIVALLALPMLLSALGWLTAPADAAESLGMPLLDGVGRSTQVGDFIAFFAAGGSMMLIGAWRGEAPWLVCAALLLGFAAIGRTVATIAHDAPLAVPFIAFELVCAAALLGTAVLLGKRPA